ncbi:MAG: FHA domain-containing protein [Bacteriovoracaceae bacterium]|nr:FHA domain-containing protein [Bacteriovoracaceae bacterium]
MAERSVQIVRDFRAPVKSGTHYRLICMTGENKGLTYYINAKRIIMGRSDTADIQVLDTKCSREHVELKKVGTTFVVTDLGSQNGIVVNDLKVTQHQLSPNDSLIIGQTVYKYGVVNVASLEEVVQEEADDDDDDDDEYEEEEDNNPKKKKSKVRLILIVVILLGGAIMLMDDSSGPEKKVRNKKNDITDVSDSFSKQMRSQHQRMDKDLEIKLSTIVHRGLREYREGNYFRAMTEFNMALVLSPKHGNASFYLQKTKQKLNAEIEANFLKAKREVDAIKYREAFVSYCTVIRLLGNNISDKRSKDALERIEEIEEKIGLEKGEIKCFEK